MSFIIDKQTLDDLNVFGKRGKSSVYALFNQTATRGGAELMEQLFHHPLSNAAAIQQRTDAILLFSGITEGFPFRSHLFDIASDYLSSADERSGLSHDPGLIRRYIRKWMGTDTDFQRTKKGLLCLLELLQEVNIFVQQLQQKILADHSYAPELQAIRQLLATPEWEQVYTVRLKKISYGKIAFFDNLLRFRHKQKVELLLQYLFRIDVFIAAGKVAKEKGFVFPQVLPSDQQCLHLADLFHPELQKPVHNSISVTQHSNIIFLTGANMAGKSTFMKSLGIAVFLAHLGFPVPASAMSFSVMDGLLTTINLPDNLDMGYSHFYVEVLRVKKVMSLLKQQKKMFIIFDEMFRGTNVKDAYDGTVAITGKFAQYRSSAFVVSTHIMEAGETLQPLFSNICFLFLPGRLENNIPVYTRKLEEGISADRHGMIIINNEGILETLQSGRKSATQQTIGVPQSLIKFNNNEFHNR